MSKRLRWAAAAALAASLCAGSATGSGLGAAPVSLEFGRGQKALSTTVSNPGDAAVRVQVRVFRWSSEGDGEAYAPTSDIGFSPPMFELAAGERQVVRLVLRKSPPAEGERAYRVIIDQLPEPDVEGLQMPVRMILPVFAGGTGRRAAALRWSAERAADGGLTVVAVNEGGRRAKLLDLELKGQAGVLSVQAGLAGYVLAGESRRWRVPAAPAGPLVVQARTENGPISVALPAP